MKVILDEGGFLPTSSHKEDAGYDLYSRTTKVIQARSRETFDIGVHIDLPNGTMGYITSRSGMNRKKGIACEGVVDCGYSGSICVTLFNHSDEPYIVNEGDRIAQLIVVPILKPELEVVKGFEATARGDNGFGSSGR